MWKTLIAKTQQTESELVLSENVHILASMSYQLYLFIASFRGLVCPLTWWKKEKERIHWANMQTESYSRRAF